MRNTRISPVVSLIALTGLSLLMTACSRQEQQSLSTTVSEAVVSTVLRTAANSANRSEGSITPLSVKNAVLTTDHRARRASPKCPARPGINQKKPAALPVIASASVRARIVPKTKQDSRVMATAPVAVSQAVCTLNKEHSQPATMVLRGIESLRSVVETLSNA